MQMANLEYEVKNDAPYLQLSSIFGAIHTSDSNSSVVNNRPMMEMSFNSPDLLTDYLSVSSAFRTGEKNMKKIEFPLRMGNITFIKAIPASNLITILFRHDSIMATPYSDEGDEGGQFHQPYFYFVVNIDTKTGKKRYTTIQPLHGVGGRAFPHNTSSSSTVYTTNCDGSYGMDLTTALREDNLGIFLGQMNHLIAHGTNYDDEYGNSCEYFYSSVTPDDVHIRVTNLLEAQIIAISNSDPEGAPFDYNMEDQSRTFSFSNPAIERVYLKTMCESINQNEVQET